MSNGLEIILQNQSFTTDDLSTDLQFETAQKVCGFLEWIYLFLMWHGPNCGRIRSRPTPNILVVYANGAPWCCEQSSPVCALPRPSGSTRNPPSSVSGWISFSLFIPYLPLHSAGQCIHSPSFSSSFNEYLWAPTFTDAGTWGWENQTWYLHLLKLS